MSLLDIIGWFGSAVLVYSVMQARVMRFRVLNLIACVILTGFNAALEIWPMVAMNVVLCLINLWHIRALSTDKAESPRFAVVSVGTDSELLQHVLVTHYADITHFQPDFFESIDASVPADARLNYLILHGDELAGLVLIERHHDQVAQVLLDYATPKFRDLSPGRFLWQQSDVLVELGDSTRVRTPARMVQPYYAKLGFTPDADTGAYTLDLRQRS